MIETPALQEQLDALANAGAQPDAGATGREIAVPGRNGPPPSETAPSEAPAPPASGTLLDANGQEYVAG